MVNTFGSVQSMDQLGKVTNPAARDPLKRENNDDIDGRSGRKREEVYLVSGRFSPSVVENERADAGRNGNTRLARPYSRARSRIGKK